MNSMMYHALYNLGALGLLAWILGAAAVGFPRKRRGLSFFSFSLCAAAMLLQFYEIRYRCAINDTSAIMDTIGAICFAATVLAAVTVLLNGTALLRRAR